MVLIACVVGALPAPRAMAQARPERTGLHVVVTIPPVKGLVSPLLPAGSEIRSLMAPGRSAHGYEFTPGDLAALSKADLVVLVGLGLEVRVENELRDHPVQGRVVLNLGEALGLKQGSRVAKEPHDEHSHDSHAHEDDEHEGGPDWVDQHVWLDPVLVSSLIPKMKEAVADATARHGGSTESRASLDAAAEEWTKQVADVDAEYARRLGPIKGRVFVTHHNAFSRLANRYGLKVSSIRQLEDSEPTPGEIAAAVKAIRQEGARAVFVEPQMNRAVPTRIAEVAKVKLGVLDPLGDGDWSALMRKNLDALVAGLGDPADSAAPAEPSKDAAPAKDSRR